MKYLSVLLALTTLALAWPAPAGACGPDSACAVRDGEYRIRLPEDMQPGDKVGAVIFFHGWRGSAEREMRNRALERAVSSLGLALIAPQGKERTWSFPGSPSTHRDEIAFVDTVIEDVTRRFPIRQDRIMASGFSMGGSMVWFLACRLDHRFAGYAPIAGAFWDPIPDSCDTAGDGAPYITHVHGTDDNVVPIAGRKIGNSSRQSDVYKSLDVWLRKVGQAVEPDTYLDAELTCRRWGVHGSGPVELCLHDGGHSIRTEWITRAWRGLVRRNGW